MLAQVHIKAAMRNAKVKLALTPEQRLANAVRARNLLIEEEKRRAQVKTLVTDERGQLPSEYLEEGCSDRKYSKIVMENCFGLIVDWLLRDSQKQLCKNEMRKKMAEGAASAEASQRGLMEAFTTVVSR